MKKILSLILFSTLFSLNSCTEEAEKSQVPDLDSISNALEGKWTVTELMGQSTQDSLLPYGKAFLTFEPKDSTFAGYTGCNQISGMFLVGEDKAQFPQFVTTRKACPLSFEMEFQDALRTVRSYSVKEDLIFSDSTGTTILILKKTANHPLSISHD
ncbi:MAG: META domain-containing protein [Bacteroidota bacterium]|nr:META domain-containing protein [Bacteroidota bacterium]